MIHSDRGSASIWVLCCAVVLLAAGYLAAVRTAAVGLRHRAETAADLAALAAAGQFGVSLDGCARARAIASANRGVVVSCALTPDPSGRGGAARIRVVSQASLPVVGRASVTASALAARASR